MNDFQLEVLDNNERDSSMDRLCAVFPRGVPRVFHPKTVCSNAAMLNLVRSVVDSTRDVVGDSVLGCCLNRKVVSDNNGLNASDLDAFSLDVCDGCRDEEIDKKVIDSVGEIRFQLEMNWYYYAFMDAASDFASCKAVFEEMVSPEWRIYPSILLFSVWLKKCKTSEEREFVYSSLSASNVQPDIQFLNAWFSFSGSLDESKGVVDKMVSLGLSPNLVTQPSILKSELSSSEKAGVFSYLEKLRHPSCRW